MCVFLCCRINIQGDCLTSGVINIALIVLPFGGEHGCLPWYVGQLYLVG